MKTDTISASCKHFLVASLLVMAFAPSICSAGTTASQTLTPKATVPTVPTGPGGSTGGMNITPTPSSQ